MTQVNKLELAIELAHNRTYNECLNPIGDFVLIHNFEDENDLYTQDNVYKPEVQEVFNKYYDYYISIIEKWTSKI